MASHPQALSAIRDPLKEVPCRFQAADRDYGDTGRRRAGRHSLCHLSGVAPGAGNTAPTPSQGRRSSLCDGLDA